MTTILSRRSGWLLLLLGLVCLSILDDCLGWTPPRW